MSPLPRPRPEPPPWKPDLYVVARFLDRLSEPDRAFTRAQLQLAVRLNWDLFRRYLAFLEARGLVAVEKAGERDVVALTAAGRETRRRLLEWVRDVVGDDAW